MRERAAPIPASSSSGAMHIGAEAYQWGQSKWNGSTKPCEHSATIAALGSNGPESPPIGKVGHGKRAEVEAVLSGNGNEDWSTPGATAVGLGVKRCSKARSPSFSNLFAMLISRAFLVVVSLVLALGFLSLDPLGRPALHGRHCAQINLSQRAKTDELRLRNQMDGFTFRSRY